MSEAPKCQGTGSVMSAAGAAVPRKRLSGFDATRSWP